MLIIARFLPHGIFQRGPVSAGVQTPDSEGLPRVLVLAEQRTVPDPHCLHCWCWYPNHLKERLNINKGYKLTLTT